MRILRLIRDLLREIADEGPYRRYLEAEGRVASPEAWRAFSDQRLKAKYARGRCC